LKVERDSQFNTAGGSEFQVRGAVQWNLIASWSPQPPYQNPLLVKDVPRIVQLRGFTWWGSDPGFLETESACSPEANSGRDLGDFVPRSCSEMWI